MPGEAQQHRPAAPAPIPQVRSSGAKPLIAQCAKPGHAVAGTPRKLAVVQPAGYGKPTGAPLPDKLEYGSSTDATTGAMVLYRYDLTLVDERTFSSGGGLHAEEKVIAYLQALVNNGTLTPQGAGVKDYILFLNLSKSPCSSVAPPGGVATRTDGNPGCLQLLTALNVGGLTSVPGGLNVTFAVQLAATKPYYGKVAGGKASSTTNYGGFGGGGTGGGSFGFVR